MVNPWVPSTRSIWGKSLITDRDFDRDPKVIGRVLGMQQAAFKLRTAAQPSGALQLHFSGLHDYLALVGEAYFGLSWCVSDQSYGAAIACDNLTMGRDIYTIDLSAATDRFPRKFSLALLDSLGLSGFAEDLEDVCNRGWQDYIRGNAFPTGRTVYYETGQPMGLYASFPLFTLSNAIICEIAAEDAEVGSLPFRDGTFFKVLGDDVIFSDRSVAERYRELMEELGVEISPTKSFSGSLGEFAGFILTKSRNHQLAFRPFKVGTSDYIADPISLLDSIGKPLSQVSDKWARRLMAFSQTVGKRSIDLNPYNWETSQERIIRTHPGKTYNAGPSIQSTILRCVEEIDYLSRKLPSNRDLQAARQWTHDLSWSAKSDNWFTTLVQTACGFSTDIRSGKLSDYAFSRDTAYQRDREAKLGFDAHVSKKLGQDPLLDL
jgi:hypothetical protein